MTCREGHPPRHPDFEPGNAVAQTHGALSPRALAPLVDNLVAELVAVAPWCGRPAFTWAVQAWARAEGQCQLLTRWLDEVGWVDEHRNPRPATALLHKTESRATSLRGELGLSPQSWARLAALIDRATTGDDGGVLDQLREEGRAILAAQERSQ